MTKHLFYVLLLTIVAGGCDNVEFKKTKGGMPYKLWASEKGKKVENGKFVKYHVTQKMNDSMVFSTYAGLPDYFQVRESDAKYDISEIMTTLKEGDSIMTIQMMDTFIKRDPTLTTKANIKNGDKFISTLKILKVFDSAQDYVKDEEDEIKKRTANEPEVVTQYLKKNNVQAVKTPGGTYVEILNPGTGEKVDTGKFVSVMYTGRNFQGKVFDSNTDPTFGHTEPLGFTVGRQEMLPGFDEAVRMLKVGGKARFYIPSMQAYGPRGRAPKIGPFESLIFDVEVISVSNKPPPPPPMQQQPVQHPGDKEPH